MGVLNGKVAIVTGASSGIGWVAARLFAHEGAKLVLTARRQEVLGALARDIDRAGGTRANAILPGGTDTPMNVARAPGAPPDMQAFIEGLHALKRIASPDEIARAALYLASDGASFVTGAAFLVDGGVSVNRT